MRRAWASLGLRGRLALSIGALIVVAFGLVFAVVRVEMSHERHVIKHEETREGGAATRSPEAEEGPSISPIEDAQSDVQKTFILVGGATLAMALSPVICSPRGRHRLCAAMRRRRAGSTRATSAPA